MNVARSALRPPEPLPSEREPLVWLARALLGALAVVICLWTVQRTTWYLAIDQFGYLTFASDLAQGRVLHDWTLLPALESFFPKGVDVDVYSQTYVRRGDVLYCRYSPGFPIVLAAVRVLFGPTAQHYVNPVAAALLFVCLYAVGARALRSEWLGLASALLGALLPNYVLLWSTSPLRDVPAHLFALAGLALLLPGGTRLRPGVREALAGFLLGFSVSTRVDAVLYLVPAGLLALLARTAFLRRLALGALGFAVGVAPLLAYNYLATGNPLRPTQAMEVEEVISEAPRRPATSALAALSPLPSVALAATGEAPAAVGVGSSGGVPRPTPVLVQGGGLRLSNLSRTLPVNFTLLRAAFGDLGIALGVLGGLSALRSPPLFLLTVPYTILAVLFFSMWTIPGPRYLAGVLLLFPLLILEGARAAATLPVLAAARLGRRAAIAVLVLLAGVALAFVEHTPFDVPNALPWVTVVLAAAAVAGAAAGTWTSERTASRVAVLSLALGLAATFAVRATSSLGVRARFQQAEVERARAVVEAALEKPAVVLTTTGIGRPVENINYYTSADAIYLEEMTRWRAQPRYVLARLLRAEYAVYLLVTPEYAKRWLANTNISTWYDAEIAAVIPPARAQDYFVASPYHRGIELWLVRLRLKEPGA